MFWVIRSKQLICQFTVSYIRHKISPLLSFRLSCSDHAPWNLKRDGLGGSVGILISLNIKTNRIACFFLLFKIILNYLIVIFFKLPNLFLAAGNKGLMILVYYYIFSFSSFTAKLLRFLLNTNNDKHCLFSSTHCFRIQVKQHKRDGWTHEHINKRTQDNFGLYCNICTWKNLNT